MNTRQHGFTYIEILISLTILLVGFLALAASIRYSIRISAETGDAADMNCAFRNVIEAIREVPFPEVEERFGPGSKKDRVWCRADGTVVFEDPGDAVARGRVEIFANESSIPKSFDDLAPGFDLNANGIVESSSVSDYKVLPLRISFTAIRPDGVRNISVDYLLSKSQFLW